MNKYKENSKATTSYIRNKTAGAAVMCLRKTSFKNEKDAADRAAAIAEEDGPHMRPYKCPHCYTWHLTKKALHVAGKTATSP